MYFDAYLISTEIEFDLIYYCMRLHLSYIRQLHTERTYVSSPKKFNESLEVHRV